MRLNRILVRF